MTRSPEKSATRQIEAAAARWVARRDAGLSDAEAQELQCWIDVDPRHRAALDFYSSAWSALAQPSHSEASASLDLHLAALADRRRWRRRVAGGAASIFLLSVAVITWYPGGRAPEDAPTAIVLLPVRQTLPDGSGVELKGDARISVDYTAHVRRVRLARGVAYFLVQKDSGRPFVVSARGVEVRAVGTSFTVGMNATSVEVLVTDGKVAVGKVTEAQSSRTPAVSAEIATLDAGRRVVVEIAPSAFIPEVSALLPTEVDERLAWRNPRLEFTRTPLAEAVALLNQHAPSTAARLTVADANLAAMRITGIFRANNTDAFVMLLEGAFGVKAQRSGDTILLRKASAQPEEN